MSDLRTDEAEWLEWRKQGVTATDIADAANGSYGGQYSVVGGKLGRIVTEVTDVMERGHRWQPVLADMFHAATGHFVVGEETWMEWADDPTIRATVDGFIALTPEADLEDVLGVAEIKTYGMRVDPPMRRWEDQTQIQMLASGTERAVIIAARIDDDEDALQSFWFREVERDDSRIEFLLLVAERLKGLLADGTLPTPDQFTDLADVKQVNADADETLPPVDLNEHAADVDRFIELKSAAKEIGQELDVLEAKIRHHIGESLSGETDAWTVNVSKPARVLPADAEERLVAAYPDFARTVLDKTGFKKVFKQVYEDATIPGGARRITHKEKK